MWRTQKISASVWLVCAARVTVVVPRAFVSMSGINYGQPQSRGVVQNWRACVSNGGGVVFELEGCNFCQEPFIGNSKQSVDACIMSQTIPLSIIIYKPMIYRNLFQRGQRLHLLQE